MVQIIIWRWRRPCHSGKKGNQQILSWALIFEIALCSFWTRPEATRRCKIWWLLLLFVDLTTQPNILKTCSYTLRKEVLRHLVRRCRHTTCALLRKRAALIDVTVHRLTHKTPFDLLIMLLNKSTAMHEPVISFGKSQCLEQYTRSSRPVVLSPFCSLYHAPRYCCSFVPSPPDFE